MDTTLTEVQTKVASFLTEYGFQIIGALIILGIGAFLARWVGRKADQWLERKRVDPPVRSLVVRLLRLLMFGLAIVLALDKFGVPITPMIAGLSVAGVGIGLAMQGVLGNLVAGLTIIFTKPFRIGEYIQLLGVQGEVITIELFSTTLLHPDRSRVVIPNRKIVGEILHNYGTIRQLDLVVGVAYGTDLERAMSLIRDLVAANRRVLKDPAAGVGIATLGDSAITISIKPWTTVADFGPAGPEIYQEILRQFRAQRIEIPFPQREVRMLGSA